MHMTKSSWHFTISVYQDIVTIKWNLENDLTGSLTCSKRAPDGNWTLLLVKLKNDSVECNFDDGGEDAIRDGYSFSFASWYKLLEGSVTLGGMDSFFAPILTDADGNSLDFADHSLTTATPPGNMTSGMP